jgi:hypothetical protein
MQVSLRIYDKSYDQIPSVSSQSKFLSIFIGDFGSFHPAGSSHGPWAYILLQVVFSFK